MRFLKKAFTRRLRIVAISLVILAVLLVTVSNVIVLRQNSPRLFSHEADIPAQDFALVLGANPNLRDGRPNLHFAARIEAAAHLFHAGKVRHILVSGDNHRVGYDEPTAMKNALVVRGVPASAITCDFAGFRTLDSIVRARRVFGITRAVIVTQRYHNTRALAIARHSGVDAVGFCAADVNFRDSICTELREVVARACTLIDLHLLHRRPKFLGPDETIVLASR